MSEKEEEVGNAITKLSIKLSGTYHGDCFNLILTYIDQLKAEIAQLKADATKAYDIGLIEGAMDAKENADARERAAFEAGWTEREMQNSVDENEDKWILGWSVQEAYEDYKKGK